MADAASSDEIDPSEVQRIRDALAELRRLDAEVIAAWRTLREIQNESEKPDLSKVPARRWFNACELEARLKGLAEMFTALLLWLVVGLASVWSVWLGCTDGPSVSDRSAPVSAVGQGAQPAEPEAPGGGS